VATNVKAAFEGRLIILPIDAVIPLRKPSDEARQSSKFRRIAQSIAEVGVIEPLVVARPTGGDKRYLLLDGNLRFAILVERGETDIRCLVSDDDEAFTYNKRINRLATIQEHYMIMRAIKQGVSEDKLAKALSVDVKSIKRRRLMLDGLCPEVIDLLKERTISINTLETLRRMKAARQIEAVELMIAMANFSSAYAKALLAATRQSDLAQFDKPKKVGKMTMEQMARMEREMATLNQDFRALEVSYGDDVLQLVISAGYVGRLITNPAVEEYLAKRQPELLEEMRTIVAAASLDQATVPAVSPTDDEDTRPGWVVESNSSRPDRSRSGQWKPRGARADGPGDAGMAETSPSLATR
jgi:ParB-like chromosome segregation protein Spo0J